MILVLLVVAWAIVLGPWLLRSRSDRGSMHSLDDLRTRLATLQHYRQTGGVRVARSSIGAGGRRSSGLHARRARKRRRDILSGLVALSVGTALVGILPGFRVLWLLHGVIDVVLAAYVMLLISLKRSSGARTVRVHERDLAFAFHRIDD